MYAQADLSLCWSHISHCWKSYVVAHLWPSFFKGGRCTWQLAFGSNRYHAVTYRYKNCDVTSWGSHSPLLERAIVNVQAPCDRKNPSVLWLKYKLNINKTGIFAFHFNFLYFFNVNDDHSTFFKGTCRIRFLVRSN